MSNLTDEHQARLDEIDTLNYDPQTEGVNTALTCFLDLDFDSAIVGLSHHLRGKVMGWCEMKNTLLGPGVMDFELWTAELGDFAVVRLRRASAQRCAVNFHPVFLPEWGYRLGAPTEREEWEERKIRNQRAKAHLKAVLRYVLEQMRVEAQPTQPSADIGQQGETDELDYLEKKILMIVQPLRNDGQPTGDENVAARLPTNSRGRPYSREWINKKRNAMRKRGIDV